MPLDALILSPFPADSVVETMMTDLNLVVGRRARMDIARGVPITSGMITEEPGNLLGAGSDAAIAIPPGLTAISIPMTRLSGIAYAMRPGDQVDVLVSLLMVDIDPDFQTILPNISSILIGPDGNLITGVGAQRVEVEAGRLVIPDQEPLPIGRAEGELETGTLLYARPSEAQRPRLVSQRLVENATVLHVGSFSITDLQPVQVQPVPEAAAAPGAAQQPAASPAQTPPDIITLIVSPQDALAINWAIKSGVDLVLTLRSPGDGTETSTTSVTLQYLVDSYNITVPGRLPYGLEPRIESPVGPVLPSDASPAAPEG
jgi:Flp pilus assembly protein CpaB